MEWQPLANDQRGCSCGYAGARTESVTYGWSTVRLINDNSTQGVIEIILMDDTWVFNYTRPANTSPSSFVDVVSYEACNVCGWCATASTYIQLDCGCRDDPPIARDDLFIGPPRDGEEWCGWSVLANDDDNEPLSLLNAHWLTLPIEGYLRVEFNDWGQLTWCYTPHENHTGCVVFNYEVCDCKNQCDHARVIFWNPGIASEC
jgi:hypothetical protein